MENYVPQQVDMYMFKSFPETLVIHWIVHADSTYLPLIFFSGTSGNGGVKGRFRGVVKLLVLSLSFFANSTFCLCCLAFMCTVHTATDLTIDLHKTQVS